MALGTCDNYATQLGSYWILLVWKDLGHGISWWGEACFV